MTGLYLAATDDARAVATWSGTPFHLLQAAPHGGLALTGLALDRPGAAARLAWNAGQAMRLRRPGGFQYSDAFLEALWRRDAARVRGGAVLNCFQLYPPSLLADPALARWFYIDATLAQLFGEYGTSASPAMRRHALAREAEGYRGAAGVICHSAWAARSVVADYGVAPGRVHVVVPGANLDRAALRAWDASARTERVAAGPLRLVFVGKDWRRKGLDRLLAAMALARGHGAELSLRVLGCARGELPPALAATPGVEWCGMVDKEREAARFLALVGEGELGCLLSRAEMGGMALREFAALGLPALAPAVGGSPEHAGAAVLVAPDAGADSIAQTLVTLARRGPELAALRQGAWAQRHAARWDAAVAALAALLAP